MLQKVLQFVMSVLRRLRPVKPVPVVAPSTPVTVECPAKLLRTIAEAEARYGTIVNGVWADEPKWCSLLEVGSITGAGWINSEDQKPVTHIYCNKDIQPYLIQALTNVRDRGLLHQLQTYDGCLNERLVRNSAHVLSAHAFGIAVDVCAKTNVMYHKPSIGPALVDCFTDVGWVWGGDFVPAIDGMHFSMAGWEAK